MLLPSCHRAADASPCFGLGGACGAQLESSAKAEASAAIAAELEKQKASTHTAIDGLKRERDETATRLRDVEEKWEAMQHELDEAKGRLREAESEQEQAADQARFPHPPSTGPNPLPRLNRWHVAQRADLEARVAETRERWRARTRRAP